MSEWLKINNVGRFICGNFTPTGTPYNFTINNSPKPTLAGPFYTGWDLAPTNPSDSIYSIRLSSGSYVEITYSGNIEGTNYGLSWHGMNRPPDNIFFRLDEPFELYSGTTPLYQLTNIGTSVKVSGFLPRQYNYLILRPVFMPFGGIGPPSPRITVSGNFGFLAPSPNCLKIANVGRGICGDFIPTGIFNYFVNTIPFNTNSSIGVYYTGWNSNTFTRPSDSTYSIKLSSGSFVNIIYSSPVADSYGLKWSAINVSGPVSVVIDKPFVLYENSQPVTQVNGTFHRVSGFLPRDSDYLVLRSINNGGVGIPELTVFGELGFIAPTPNCIKINNVRKT